jgi:hypothetical protein
MNRRDFFVYLYTRRDHILRDFRLREGTVASPSPGCRVRSPEQLLMLSRYLVRRAENLNKIVPMMLLILGISWRS